MTLSELCKEVIEKHGLSCAGKEKVKRRCWRDEGFSLQRIRSGSRALSLHELAADDWEIVKEERELECAPVKWGKAYDITGKVVYYPKVSFGESMPDKPPMKMVLTWEE